MPWERNTKRKQEWLAWMSFINQTYLWLGSFNAKMQPYSILRVPCLASDDKMFAYLFVFSPRSKRDIFHFISHPMGVQSNERWVISVKRMNNPDFFRNKLWVIAANDRKNSWTGVTRKDRHQSTLVCLLGNCDIWKKKRRKKSLSNQVHDDTYTHLALGNSSISQDLHWHMSADLIFYVTLKYWTP